MPFSPARLRYFAPGQAVDAPFSGDTDSFFGLPAGRICSYPAGQLQSEITFCDILKAMFPGGSITGAPKIRSMEIIDETEPTARGVYTGSIGYIGIDGSVCLNIAIRTIIITNHKAYAQTGGGIVADSDPQAEWAETITKARALLAGIKATQQCKQRIIDIEKKPRKDARKSISK